MSVVYIIYIYNSYFGIQPPREAMHHIKHWVAKGCNTFRTFNSAERKVK